MLQIATPTEESALSPRQTAALPYVASEAATALRRDKDILRRLETLDNAIALLKDQQ